MISEMEIQEKEIDESIVGASKLVDEDEERVPAFDETDQTVPPADARRAHLPRETCLNDFKFLSTEYVHIYDRQTLTVANQSSTRLMRVWLGDGVWEIDHGPAMPLMRVRSAQKK